MLGAVDGVELELWNATRSPTRSPMIRKLPVRIIMQMFVKRLVVPMNKRFGKRVSVR